MVQLLVHNRQKLLLLSFIGACIVLQLLTYQLLKLLKYLLLHSKLRLKIIECCLQGWLRSLLQVSLQLRQGLTHR